MPNKNTSYLTSQIYGLNAAKRKVLNSHSLKRFAFVYDPKETIDSIGQIVCSYVEEDGIATESWQVPIEGGFIDLAWRFLMPGDNVADHTLLADFEAERKRAIERAFGKADDEFGQLRF